MEGLDSEECEERLQCLCVCHSERLLAPTYCTGFVGNVNSSSVNSMI